MKRKILSIAGALIVASVTLPARSASAKVTVSIFDLRDRSLNADFEDATPDGCIITQTNIMFSESVTQTGGPPIIGPPTTLVSVVYANACTGEFISYMGGTTEQTFHFAPNLNSASLAATVPITDGAGNNATVTMNVQWVANAPAQAVKKTTITRNANTIVIDRVNFQTRAANVSGSVSTVLDVESGPTALDLSQTPEDGQLGQNVEGTRSVTFTSGRL